jgi:hypothetical protein
VALGRRSGVAIPEEFWYAIMTAFTRIMMTRLYPRASDPEQFETEPLPKLREAIHEYLGQLVDFVVANAGRTGLKVLKE